MKKPERLIGFVILDDIEYPFEFEEKTFSLHLYPPAVEIWEKNSDPIHLFQALSNQDHKNHEWVGQKRVEGITSESNNIIFCVLDSPANFHGFISFRVVWYFYYSKDLDIKRIEGFKITGHDVNLFYPPQVAFSSKFEPNDSGGSFDRITVTTNKQKNLYCGEYFVSDNVDAKVGVTAYISHYSNRAANPVQAISAMTTTFSAPVGIDTLIDSYYDIVNFFKYITYRNNVDIGDFEVFFVNEKNLREYEGLLVFPNKCEPESNEGKKERIIAYNLLTDRSTKIIDAIKSKHMGLRHICSSTDDQLNYPASRIIMIFAEFEREYRNIYGEESFRSDEYLTVKSEVVSLIDEYFRLQKGKKRQYTKQISDYVKKRDNSFRDNLMYALRDNEDIMSPFVSKRYEGTYDVLVDAMSSRMGVVRNGIAHSHLDLQFDAVHLSDIKIIEELIYAMRLKKIGLSLKECQMAINKLFAEYLAL